MADFTYSVGGLPHEERCFISKAAAISSRRKDFFAILNCITKARLAVKQSVIQMFKTIQKKMSVLGVLL